MLFSSLEISSYYVPGYQHFRASAQCCLLGDIIVECNVLKAYWLVLKCNLLYEICVIDLVQTFQILLRKLKTRKLKTLKIEKIETTFTYSGILQLKTTDTQYKRLASFHHRSLRTIQGNSNTCDEIQSVTNANKICACKLVRKCIDKDISDTFEGYLEINDHKMRTRNIQCLVKLPKITTEYARKSFRFMGARIYNELPISICKTESLNAYEQHLKQHFI